jgi:CDP-diacylglycerol--glycerol-3-phosphate 3-phosphatidyltransferase
MAIPTSRYGGLKTSAAGLYAIKPRFQRFLAPVADALARRGVHPDVLTYAAVGCGLIGGSALALSTAVSAWLLVVPLAAVARLMLNALDGMVAARLGMARPWGKVLNELGDRFADLAFLAPLAWLPGATVALVATALCVTLLVSFIGVLAEAAGAGRQYGGVMGKADRLLWLGLAALAALVSGSYLSLQLLPWLLIGGSALTLVQRGRKIHAAL